MKLGSSEVRRGLMMSLAEEYKGFMTEGFQASRGPYGEKWAPLKFRSSANGKGQLPLLNSGIMHNATTPVRITAEGFSVTVTAAYASTHQYGAHIVAKKAKALAFPGPVTYSQKKRNTKGQFAKKSQAGMMFRKSVTIPARPFALTKGLPPKLSKQFQEATDEFLETYFQ